MGSCIAVFLHRPKRRTAEATEGPQAGVCRRAFCCSGCSSGLRHTHVTSHLLRIRFRNACHTHINIRDFKPSGIIHDSGLWKIKYLLEYPDSLRSAGAIDAIGCQRGNCRIISGNPVQLLLQLTDFFPGGSDSQVIPRPGRRHSRNDICGIDVHIITVIIMDDINSRISLIRQRLGPPLT